MDEIIKSEIEQGIAQVDNSLTITEFVCDYDKDKRHLSVFFKADGQGGETVEVRKSYDN